MTIKTHGRMFTDKSVNMAQINVTDGTDGQALVTDGSGALRFATVGVGGSVGSSTYVEDRFTQASPGTVTKFQMTATAALEESLFVFVDGVAQPTTTFTLSSSGSGIGANGALDEINITPAIATGQQLRVCHLGINTAIADNSITGSKIAMTGDQQGDIMIYNSPNYQRLGIGTAGQHLATNAGATAPEWVTPATVGGLPIKIWHANTTSQFSTTSEFGASTADGSIPQDTEGIPLLNLSITASATTNKLLFHFYATHGSTSTPAAATALFRTSGPNASADALFAAVGHVNEAAFGAWHTVESALTTSASNYQVRFARANSGTVGANHMGGNTAENYSTASKINLTVIEYIP